MSKWNLWGRLILYVNRMVDPQGDLSLSRFIALYTMVMFFINIGWVLILASYLVLKGKTLPPAADVLAWNEVFKTEVSFAALIYVGGKGLAFLPAGAEAVASWWKAKQGDAKKDPPPEGVNQ